MPSYALSYILRKLGKQRKQHAERQKPEVSVDINEC